MNELLGRAEEAFSRHAEEEALQHLLEAWRSSRAEHIAALVERLSKRLTAGLSPLDCEPGSFIMLERRPLNLTRLLASVLEGADRGFPGALRQSLRAFKSWPADPRFTPVLLAITRMPVASDLGVPDVLYELIDAVGDPRAVDPLLELRAGLVPGTDAVRRLDTVVQHLDPARFPPLDAEASRRCEELEDALSTREASEARSASTREALLARVYADPEDIPARMVLADHLMEHGDPLGEFITLQCAPQVDAARIEQLLEANRSRWVDPFGPSVLGGKGSVHFARGLPAIVRMNTWGRELLIEPGPCWQTVRDIDWAHGVFRDVAEWLAHPHLRNVRGLWNMDAEMALGLGSRPLAVRSLSLLGPVSERAPKLFVRLSELPSLERLRVQNASPDDVRLCAGSRLASRLVDFEAEWEGAWALRVKPRHDLPVLATLETEEGAEPLSRAIRGAAGFGTRALRIQVMRGTWRSRKQLEEAVFGYTKVEWE
ncbi:TIGR02996 domain-containing protein [Pyxidicoccus sp. 3LG]